MRPVGTDDVTVVARRRRHTVTLDGTSFVANGVRPALGIGLLALLLDGLAQDCTRQGSHTCSDSGSSDTVVRSASDDGACECA